MSDFDDVMIDADADIFTDLGDPATITDTESPATSWDIRVVVDHDLQLIVDDAVQVYGTVLTLEQPPAGIASGWTLEITDGRHAGSYTLRQLIERDNWVQRWAAMQQ